MSKYPYLILPIIACLLKAQPTIAAPWDCETLPMECISDLNVQIGYRYDTLNWNTGLGDWEPNILSELSWDDLNSVQIGVEWLFECPNFFYSRASAFYACSFTGTVQDSDFFRDDRQAEYKRSISNASGSHFVDFTIGAGKVFCHSDGYFTIAPLVGYSFHLQYLKIRNGKEILPVEDPLIQNSHFTARWQSLWVGADMTIPSCTPWEFRLTYEIHAAFYTGTGFWALRDDYYDDFRHHATGIGQVAIGAAAYRITECFDLNFSAKIQDWCAFSGTHHVFYIDRNGQHKHAKICLNRVNWFSLSLLLGANFSF